MVWARSEERTGSRSYPRRRGLGHLGCLQRDFVSRGEVFVGVFCAAGQGIVRATLVNLVHLR